MPKYEKLNREDLLKRAKDSIVTKDIDVPEWETTVTIKELSGLERGRYERSIMSFDRKSGNIVPELTHARARLVSMSLVDEHGKRMFDDTEESLLTLGSLPSKGLDRIYEAAQELSGLSEDDHDQVVENFSSAGESSTSD
jgi:hypothetical protein